MMAYVGFCALSAIVNPGVAQNLLGSPYIRLGSLGLIACIIIAWLTSAIREKALALYIYLLIAGLAVLSLPYTWLKFESLDRIGGLFAQPDILAALVGCGFLIGLRLNLSSKYKYLLWISQAFLGALILLTQTRSIVILIILIICIQIVLRRQWKMLAVIGVATLGIYTLVPGRLADQAYAQESLAYRWQLQTSALEIAATKPFGYGAGSLVNALDCQNLKGNLLAETCSEGFAFNSSHNVFLDRFLAVGWLGGLGFLSLVFLAIFRGIKNNNVFVWPLILIGGYYLTNVTHVVLELLLWIFIIQCLVSKLSRASASP